MFPFLLELLIHKRRRRIKIKVIRCIDFLYKTLKEKEKKNGKKRVKKENASYIVKKITISIDTRC